MNPYDSTELIKEVSAPKLVIHNQDDEVVPFFMGEELFEQLVVRGSFGRFVGSMPMHWLITRMNLFRE